MKVIEALLELTDLNEEGAYAVAEVLATCAWAALDDNDIPVIFYMDDEPLGQFGYISVLDIYGEKGLTN